MSGNNSLLERRMKNIPRGISTAFPIFAAGAKNAVIHDVEGKRYIDFAGGIGVLNTGHCHPKIVQAIEEQAKKYIHTAFQVMGYEPYIAVTEKLNNLAPISGDKKSILFSTGAEALENAVKIARVATKRTGFISFTGGFHGRTMMALALTGKVLPYKKGFGPFPGDVYHIPFPIPYHGITEEETLHVLQNVFKSDIDAERVAAIAIEPVQGEGGFYIAPFGFLKKLRKICDDNGILLISDEVQSGFARTGRLFAIEHSGVEPDLITSAKSLAGGMPLSAVIGRAQIMDSVEPGGLGGTYAGNPLACAASLAVMEIIEEERILEKSIRLGDVLQNALKKLSEEIPVIGEIRGLGGMVALEFVKEKDPHKPDPDLAKKISQKCMENGLIILSCGIYGNVLRILVPITADLKEIDEGIEILRKSSLEVLNR